MWEWAVSIAVIAVLFTALAGVVLYFAILIRERSLEPSIGQLAFWTIVLFTATIAGSTYLKLWEF